MAIWSELFTNARIIGIDIDLNNMRENYFYLKSKGAFKIREPELRYFNFYDDKTRYLEKILHGYK